MITLYGIPNCDTTKKAMNWLAKNRIAYHFHDYKTQGADKVKLEEWIKLAGTDTIFNKRSTTWKELPAAEQNKAATTPGMVNLMQQHNSIIKRPIIEGGKKLLVGYSEKEYAANLV